MSVTDFEQFAILFWEPFCFDHSNTGHISHVLNDKTSKCFIKISFHIEWSRLAGNLIFGPVFERLKQDGQPFKNRKKCV
jgi:hypothetical protein